MKLTEVNLKNKINFFNEGTWSIIDQVSINFYPTKNSGGKGGCVNFMVCTLRSCITLDSLRRIFVKGVYLLVNLLLLQVPYDI